MRWQRPARPISPDIFGWSYASGVELHSRTLAHGKALSRERNWVGGCRGDLVRSGSVVGPVAGGFLVDSASYGAAFALAAAVLGGAAILGSAAPETSPGEPAMPTPSPELSPGPADLGRGPG